MRKSLIICFTLLSVVSCLGQKYNSIKFDTVNRNTSAKELFLKKIIAKDNSGYQDDDDKIYNAVEAFEKFKQTRDAVQYDLKLETNDKIIIGKLFGIERYVDSDTIFKYENLCFNRFSIFSDAKDKTAAYKLYSDNQDEAKLNKFIEKYTGLYKNLSGIDNDYLFELNDRTIILKKSNRNEVSPMSMSEASPEPMSEPSPTPKKESKKENPLSSVSIEFIVVFKNLTVDLQKYLEDNIYSQ